MTDYGVFGVLSEFKFQYDVGQPPSQPIPVSLLQVPPAIPFIRPRDTADTLFFSEGFLYPN